MKLTERNGLRILEAEPKKFLATKDKKTVFESNLYLGKFDKQENYVEITATEKKKIFEEQAKLAKELEEKR